MTQSRTYVEDLYPSRVSEHPSIIRRVDPVVYRNHQTDQGPLSAQQLASYEQKGYLSLRGFFSTEEVQEWRDELTRLWQENRHSTSKEVVAEPSSREIRSIFAVHRDNEVFQRLSRHPRLVAMIEQILGSEVYIHQSRINYKQGYTGKEFYWHSDFETWHVEDGMPRMRALSCSIALEENFHYNGPLLLLPGSHKSFVSCVGQTPDSHYEQSLRKQEYGVPDQESLRLLVEKHGIDTMIGPVGTVVLFDCNTMHGSNGNITPLPRSNVFMVYNSVDNRLVAPYSGQQPRPEYIAARE
ncbi:ectoine hydroxylase [Brevibacillus choshinensis]|uniref:Ectoine hydroxylase n=1 Tax=Brevibacillus choshinensis TaxID=54911 RepID=A0ABX7FKB1_BRECH|nr:ectoine hydroxylase [Brevibacillus choshinensis]QRG66643.1 ectoine hydroxylase [Brevibacillus choshinensis]